MCEEDKVRDKARELLNFYDEQNAISGVGQQTTFNNLDKNYWKGNPNKPDGWYFPKDTTHPAIVLECANSKTDLIKKDEQIKKYIEITRQKYKNVVGISYNGFEAVIYKNNILFDKTRELFDKNYYLKLFNVSKIDKQKIYDCVIKINNLLHFHLQMKELKHRMIFTAYALVCAKQGGTLAAYKGESFSNLKNKIFDYFKEIYKNSDLVKFEIIKAQYDTITCNNDDSRDSKVKNTLNEFIDNIIEISQFIQDENWSGEDVMGIFFNEFNRYLTKKPDFGQVFTPDHITSLMYRLTDTKNTDRVLDATCGSGAFLVKAMNNMIREKGGVKNEIAKQEICANHLFGIELDKDLFSLACANMLIHKDGKTNLERLDVLSDKAKEWIKSKNITKVLMNPPYENKYKCLDIVELVLDNVSKGAICAFLLPSNKFEANKKKANKILFNHRLEKIVKLPDIFAGKSSADTSIFIFTAGESQNDREIFACYIKDDGLETVKNQGRHDIHNKWQDIEDKWMDKIFKQSGDDSIQWLKPSEHLSYQMPQPEFEISEKDFKKVVLDYLLFENGIDKKDFENTMLETLLYDSDIKQDNENFTFTFKAKKDDK